MRVHFPSLRTVFVALLFVLLALSFFPSIGSGTEEYAEQMGTIDPGKKDMAADELASYDGKEGHPAYFALNGWIYDATGSPLWKEGSHVGRHLAGFDLSDALKQAPRGKEKIESMPIVGNLLTREITPSLKFTITGTAVTST